MNADFLAVLDFWEREKGISRDVLLAAVQDSLISAAKKAVGPARELRVQIDPKSGDIKAFAKLIVSEKVLSKHDQITVFDARRLKADAVLGEELEIEVTPAGFGRIASQYARQALMQQIRKAEKAKIMVDFKDRVGEIISGVVRRFDRSDVTIDLGKYEALLPNRERVPTEESRSESAFAAMSKPSRTGCMARKSSSRAATRNSSSSFFGSKSLKSVMAPSKSRPSPGSRVFAARSPFGRVTPRWIRLGRVWACAARESRISSGN